MKKANNTFNSRNFPSKMLLEKAIILPLKEQKRLHRQYIKNKDTDALHKLIFSQLRLAYSLIDAFDSGRHRDDLRSQIILTIISAIQKWEPSRGALSTLTTQMVKQKIYKFLQEENYTIRVPISAQKRYKDFMRNHPKNGQVLSPYKRTRMETIGAVLNMEYLRIHGDNNRHNGASDTGIPLSAREFVEDDVDTKLSIEETKAKLMALPTRERKIFYKFLNSCRPSFRVSNILRGTNNTIKKIVKEYLALGTCKYCHRKFKPTARLKYFCSISEQLKYNERRIKLRNCCVCGRLFVPCRQFRKICSLGCRMKPHHVDDSVSLTPGISTSEAVPFCSGFGFG